MAYHPKDLILSDASTGTINAAAATLAESSGHHTARLIYAGDGNNEIAGRNYLIDDQMLKEGNQWLLRANKSMHRSLPRQGLASDNSLSRDLYLVRYVHRLYVFGLFTQDASLLKIATDVAWPTQMYIDRFIYDQEPMDLCELYLFDTKSQQWWRWMRQWGMIDSVPKAHGVYTVLGQDRLTNAGKEALAALYP